MRRVQSPQGTRAALTRRELCGRGGGERRRGEGRGGEGPSQLGPAHPRGTGQATFAVLVRFENHSLFLVNRNGLNRVYLYFATFKFIPPSSAFCGNSSHFLIFTHSYLEVWLQVRFVEEIPIPSSFSSLGWACLGDTDVNVPV